MSDCERNVNVWKEANVCASTFVGPNPDLSDADAAIISGTDDPTNDPHLALGIDRILAKSNATTATVLRLNTQGGGVALNGSAGGGEVTAYNTTANQQERVLTLTDRFVPVNGTPISGLTQQIGSSYVGKLTEITNAAGCQLDITDASTSGMIAGDEMHFFSSGAGGITGVTVAGVQTLVQPASGTASGVGRTIILKYLSSNRWLYIGP